MTADGLTWQWFLMWDWWVVKNTFQICPGLLLSQSRHSVSMLTVVWLPVYLCVNPASTHTIWDRKHEVAWGFTFLLSGFLRYLLFLFCGCWGSGLKCGINLKELRPRGTLHYTWVRNEWMNEWNNKQLQKEPGALFWICCLENESSSSTGRHVMIVGLD